MKKSQQVIKQPLATNPLKEKVTITCESCYKNFTPPATDYICVKCSLKVCSICAPNKIIYPCTEQQSQSRICKQCFKGMIDTQTFVQENEVKLGNNCKWITQLLLELQQDQSMKTLLDDLESDYNGLYEGMKQSLSDKNTQMTVKNSILDIQKELKECSFVLKEFYYFCSNENKAQINDLMAQMILILIKKHKITYDKVIIKLIMFFLMLCNLKTAFQLVCLLMNYSKNISEERLLNYIESVFDPAIKKNKTLPAFIKKNQKEWVQYFLLDFLQIDSQLNLLKACFNEIKSKTNYELLHYISALVYSNPDLSESSQWRKKYLIISGTPQFANQLARPRNFLETSPTRQKEPFTLPEKESLMLPEKYEDDDDDDFLSNVGRTKSLAHDEIEDFRKSFMKLNQSLVIKDEENLFFANDQDMRIEMSSKIQQLQQDNQKQCEEIQLLKIEILEKKQQNQQRLDEINHQNQQIQHLNQQVQQLNAQVQQLNEEVQNLNEQVQQRDEKVQQQNEQVQKLTEQVQKQSEQIQQRSDQGSHFDEQTKHLKDQIKHLNDQITHLNEQSLKMKESHNQEMSKQERLNLKKEQRLATQVHQCKRIIESALEQQHQILSIGSNRSKGIVSGFLELCQTLLTEEQNFLLLNDPFPLIANLQEDLKTRIQELMKNLNSNENGEDPFKENVNLALNEMNQTYNQRIEQYKLQIKSLNEEILKNQEEIKQSKERTSEQFALTKQLAKQDQEIIAIRKQNDILQKICMKIQDTGSFEDVMVSSHQENSYDHASIEKRLDEEEKKYYIQNVQNEQNLQVQNRTAIKERPQIGKQKLKQDADHEVGCKTNDCQIF